MKKSSILAITLALLGLIYESVNWLVYRDITIRNHSELMKKSAYGQITHSDLRIGAYDLVEQSLCLMVNDELTKGCMSQFKANKESCSIEILDGANLEGFGKNETHELLRQFNLCRQRPV